MTYRVYFWLRGIPAERPAGPWWYRDFRSPVGALRLLNDLREHCREIRLAEIEGVVPAYSPLNIEPPPDAEVWLSPDSHNKTGDVE